LFLAANATMHLSEQKLNVRKGKTVAVDESYRLVTTVIVINSYCGKIHNIFLTTIRAAVRSRHSSFWARRGTFLLLTSRRGSDQFSTAMVICGTG
jgi:hypothetical protein